MGPDIEQSVEEWEEFESQYWQEAGRSRNVT